MPSTSPYVAGCEDHEVWRRHSEGPTMSTNSKSASARNMPTDASSDTKQRKHVLQHRLSAPTLSSSTPSAAAFRPWSSAGSNASSNADDNSGSPLTTTTVRFLGVSKKEAHCVYLVQVDTGAEQFVVQKRYSQFRDFRQQILAMLARADHCGNGPCKQLLQLTQVKFPRRKPMIAKWRKDADLTLARDRLLLLQRFVEAILRVYRMAPRRQLRCCVNTQCAAMEAVRAFLQITAVGDSALTASRASTAAPELLQVRQRSSLSPERDMDDKTASFEPNRRQTRGFPPPTRASLPVVDADHQFEQLYTITEDTELMHLHA